MAEIFTHEVVAYIFAFLMALSLLIYSVLDGYDIGVGILTAKTDDEDEKDTMVASIGPFWDANETWLVLGVGLLLVAFPFAHGVILTNLYLPVLAMLIGLIFRGVSIEFRKKVKAEQKHFWNKGFFAGSFLMAFSQGYMLGSYILGFDKAPESIIFSALAGFAVVAAYALMGATWLILRTQGRLQRKAIKWSKNMILYSTAAIIVASIGTPIVSETVFDKWFSFPEILFLSLIPILTLASMSKMYITLDKMPFEKDKLCWLPFAMTIFVFTLCFIGISYSVVPYIVPGQMLITEAAAGYESLIIIFVGALIVLPILIAYTILVYVIFKGKATELTYD